MPRFDVELLSRLQAVEEKLKLFQETSGVVQRRSPGQHVTETPGISEQHPYDFHPPGTESALAGNRLQDTQMIPPGIEEDIVDGMGAIVLTDDKEEIGFFGQFTSEHALPTLGLI